MHCRHLAAGEPKMQHCSSQRSFGIDPELLQRKHSRLVDGARRPCHEPELDMHKPKYIFRFEMTLRGGLTTYFFVEPKNRRTCKKCAVCD